MSNTFKYIFSAEYVMFDNNLGATEQQESRFFYVRQSTWTSYVHVGACF